MRQTTLDLCGIITRNGDTLNGMHAIELVM